MAAGDAHGIFISYRRDDAAGWPRTIRTELTRQLPGVEVFRDVDALEAGDVWQQEIQATLARSDVVLVLIGKRFATGDNRKRLNDSDDTLAREISMSIAAGITIVPVLVDGARFPRLKSLPEPLRVIDSFQRHEVRDVGFEGDMTALAATLRRRLDQAADRRAAERERDEREAAAARRERLERERVEREVAEEAERERVEREVAKKPDVAPPPGKPKPPPPKPAPLPSDVPSPPAVPFPMLAVLAYGYSTRGTDRHELGTGRPVLYLGGRTVALVTSRPPGSGQPPGLRIVDPTGRAAMLDLPLPRPREHRRSLTGLAQREIGEFRWGGDLGSARRKVPTVSFWTGTRIEGYARVPGLGQRGVAVFTDAVVYDARGTQMGRILNHTRSRPLADLGSWKEALPEGSWLLMDRSPDMAEPLRSFVTAVPMLLTSLWRRLNGHTLAGFVPPPHRTVI